MLHRQLETLRQAEEHTRQAGTMAPGYECMAARITAVPPAAQPSCWLRTCLPALQSRAPRNHHPTTPHLQALAEWAALSNRFGAHLSGCPSSTSAHVGNDGSGSTSAGAHLPGSPFLAAAAAEEGLALLSRQAQELADPLFLLDLAGGSDSSSGSGSSEPGAATLDDLAAAVRQQHPALFGRDAAHATGSGTGGAGGTSGGGSTGGGAAARRLEQAAALADVLYRQQRFKFEPFEWVYEGLPPLLLPERLARRKLAPVTLATVAAGVARRLGLPLLPVPAEANEEIAAAVAEGPAGGAAAGGLPLDQLRPDVAQRYAGRAAAAPPTAGPWALLLDCSSDSSSGHGGVDGAQGRQPGQHWTHAVDACTGELLDAAGAAHKYPGLQLVRAAPRLHKPPWRVVWAGRQAGWLPDAGQCPFTRLGN